MLETLLNNGKTIGLFKIKKLSELDTNQRIKSNVEVIDFDLVKDDIFKVFNEHQYGFDKLKSCDALKIIPSENRLDFIELKGIEEFCSRNRDLEKEHLEEALQKQVSKFNLPNKIFHSLSILTIIFQIKQIGLTSEQKEAYLNEVLSDFIVVIDSEVEGNGAGEIGAMLQFLSEVSNIRNEYIIRLEDIMEGINVLKIKKPKLMFQSEIDAYYIKYPTQ